MMGIAARATARPGKCAALMMHVMCVGHDVMGNVGGGRGDEMKDDVSNGSLFP